MKNKILLTIFATFLLAFALKNVSAYYESYHYGSPNAYYNYYPYSGYGEFSLSFKDRDYYDGRYYDNSGGYGYSAGPRYYWDDEDLKWRKNPVHTWIEKGDTWRERAKRARAVDFLITSWDARYAIASGKTSEEAFSYNDGAKDTKAESSSNFRYKEAYDPLVYGADSNYYQPRYEQQTQTYNWRY